MAAKQLDMKQELEDGEFVLFDDERRNRDVSSISCYFVHIEDVSTGLTRDVFVKGLRDWDNNRNK